MKHFFMEYGKIIVAGALTVTGMMFTTPFAEAVTGSVAGFTNGFEDKLTPKNPYAEKVRSVQKLYDVGEGNLTEDDIITINGVECYVLQTDNDKAELITVDIYDQRFNTNTTSSSGYIYETADIKIYMDNFYANMLGSDSYIVDTEVTYRYKRSDNTNASDLHTYNTSTITQKVFALDAVEAKNNVAKFNWDATCKMNGKGKGFWVAAACFRNHNCIGFNLQTIGSQSALSTDNVAWICAGARPVFWITLDDPSF